MSTTLADLMRQGGRRPWRRDPVDELGMPDRSGDEAYFAELLKREEPAPAPRSPGRRLADVMPPLPTQARGATRRARARGAARRARAKRQKPVNDLLAELFTSDLITGAGEAAGEGIMPYAEMPEMVRRQIPIDAPPVGWDVAKLTPAKRMLLMRLQAMGAQERNRGFR